MSDFARQVCHQFKEIFIDEFWLERSVRHLRDGELFEMADSVENFVAALTAAPPNWTEAEKYGWAIAAEGYGHNEIESLRNAVVRGLSPLLNNVPISPTDLHLAQTDPSSPGAYALAAARILPIFSGEFCVH